jgi:hypothetical protein
LGVWAQQRQITSGLGRAGGAWQQPLPAGVALTPTPDRSSGWQRRLCSQIWAARGKGCA